jgi:hypothetical protein
MQKTGTRMHRRSTVPGRSSSAAPRLQKSTQGKHANQHSAPSTAYHTLTHISIPRLGMTNLRTGREGAEVHARKIHKRWLELQKLNTAAEERRGESIGAPWSSKRASCSTASSQAAPMAMGRFGRAANGGKIQGGRWGRGTVSRAPVAWLLVGESVARFYWAWRGSPLR